MLIRVYARNLVLIDSILVILALRIEETALRGLNFLIKVKYLNYVGFLTIARFALMRVVFTLLISK